MKSAKPVLLRIWLPVAALGVWECFTRYGLLDPIFFPAPSVLAREAFGMIGTGELTGHVRDTLWRTLRGFVPGVLAGVICGILMGASRAARQSLESPVSAFVATPKIALLPVLMLVLGIGEAPRIVLIGAAAFASSALVMLDGVRDLDANFAELARNYGADSWQLVRWVYLPGCLPPLLTATRQALSRALGLSVAVEVLTGRTGLGSLIWAGWQSFQPQHVYIGVLTAALLGAVLHGSMRLIEKALVPWKA